ncbi:26S proteasome complex subunit [Conoideocrella luteorostrata]|uniref:26S proteasome complex subunit SEM1 n=1 Tax=Conoideocrella luteorostrata TaxID=1105319 RepID=A0AAJ0FTP6_9HYPO|nr:26S proteasome complex subunit [Conoideocrella luteorostrata]
MASSETTKPSEEQPVAGQDKNLEQKTTALGEDDEFEDFPVDDWPEEQTEAAQNSETKHLWEESWDDDDTTDDFSAQLKEELKKVEASKRR